MSSRFIYKWKMRIRPVFLLIIFLFAYSGSVAQDTLRLMVYNLLYYGVNTGFCSSSNNNVDLKDGYLRTIISHTHPDIFAVNELGTRSEANADRILDSVLNRVFPAQYNRVGFTNTSGSAIGNMLYFQQEKFGLYSEAVIANQVRDINLYTLFLKNDGLAHGDTTFLSCIVAHLKAGSNISDQQGRHLEIQAVMGYLAQFDRKENLIFMGDLNMKSSYETAYGLLTYHINEEIRFYDPIDQPGVWVDNPEMAPYHSQSTHTESHSCFVTGGLDDRFDQILVSKGLLQGGHGLQYLDGSYTTVGQDGQRLNRSLIDPPNLSEPEEVIMALYQMSDHLPVFLELVTTDLPNRVPAAEPLVYYGVANPVRDHLKLWMVDYQGPVGIYLYSIMGELVLSIDTFFYHGDGPVLTSVSHLPRGMYLLRIVGGNDLTGVEKLILY